MRGALAETRSWRPPAGRRHRAGLDRRRDASPRSTTASRMPLLAETRLDGTVLAVIAAARSVRRSPSGVVPAWRTARTGPPGPPRPGRRHADQARGRAVDAGRGGGRARARARRRRRCARRELHPDAVGAARLRAATERLQTVRRRRCPRRVRHAGHLRAQFVDRRWSACGRCPGVERAGAVFGLPLTGFGYRISLSERDGVVRPTRAQDMTSGGVRVVTPDYLSGHRLATAARAGHRRHRRPVEPACGAGERGRGAPAVARCRRARATPSPSAPASARRASGSAGRVVGVVGDSRERGPMSALRPTVYVPHAQFPVGFCRRGARRRPPAPTSTTCARALAGLDPDVPMFRVRTIAQLAASTVAQPRLLMLLMSLFGAAALAVAAIGLYGSWRRPSRPGARRSASGGPWAPRWPTSCAWWPGTRRRLSCAGVGARRHHRSGAGRSGWTRLVATAVRPSWRMVRPSPPVAVVAALGRAGAVPAGAGRRSGGDVQGRVKGSGRLARGLVHQPERHHAEVQERIELRAGLGQDVGRRRRGCRRWPSRRRWRRWRPSDRAWRPWPAASSRSRRDRSRRRTSTPTARVPSAWRLTSAPLASSADTAAASARAAARISAMSPSPSGASTPDGACHVATTSSKAYGQRHDSHLGGLILHPAARHAHASPCGKIPTRGPPVPAARSARARLPRQRSGGERPAGPGAGPCVPARRADVGAAVQGRVLGLAHPGARPARLRRLHRRSGRGRRPDHRRLRR